MWDGFTVRFQLPSSLGSYGETVFVWDTGNWTILLISSLKAYKFLRDNLGPFIKLFQLQEERLRETRVQSSLEEDRKEAADFVKDVECKVYFRTGRRCPQGADLAFTKPTRHCFNVLHSSFAKIKVFLSENNLNNIADNISFSSFTTLYVEYFFAWMRTPKSSDSRHAWLCSS